MNKLSFCQACGADRFTAALNKTGDALFGVEGPGIGRLANDQLGIFEEGGKWKGCWSQNYFGMFCTTPLLTGKYLACHLGTLELFFTFQGDGKKADDNGFVAPPGALPEYVTLYNPLPGPRYKNDESSGLAEEFDFWVEGNAVSVLSLCDVLLASRNEAKIRELLPKIEKCLDFILSRKDEKTNLLKVGVAGTLIERAYGATFRSKGVTDYGLPSGTVVNTIQALRLAAEVEELAGDLSQAEFYRAQAAEFQKALEQLIENDEFLINYIDADGIRHGVPGAAVHGYFETNCNHDAAFWGVVPDKTAVSILKKIISISPTPLAPCVWKIHDDSHWSYQKSDLAYGGAGSHWNGAAWFSSQARYLGALLKYGFYNEACVAAETMRNIYDSGTMRDVMSDYGKSFIGAFNPDVPDAYYIDGFGTFGGLLRGVAGLEYKANAITLTPHFPAELSSYKQLRPYYWGQKELYLRIEGQGDSLKEAFVNGKPLPLEGNSVSITYATLPEKAEIFFKRV